MIERMTFTLFPIGRSRDGRTYNTGPIIHYRVGFDSWLPGHEAEIFNFGNDQHARWRFRCTKDGVQGDWRGDYKSPEDALARFPDTGFAQGTPGNADRSSMDPKVTFLDTFNDADGEHFVINDAYDSARTRGYLAFLTEEQFREELRSRGASSHNVESCVELARQNTKAQTGHHPR